MRRFSERDLLVREITEGREQSPDFSYALPLNITITYIGPNGKIRYTAYDIPSPGDPLSEEDIVKLMTDIEIQTRTPLYQKVVEVPKISANVLR